VYQQEASPQVPRPVGSGWFMEGEDLATDSREGLTCSTGSHGTSVM